MKFYSCPEPHDTQGLTLYSLSSGTQLFSSIFTAAMFTPAIFFTPAMFTPAMLKLHGHPLSEFLKKQNADLMLGVVPRVTESRTLELTNSQIPPAPAELGYSFRGWGVRRMPLVSLQSKHCHGRLTSEDRRVYHLPEDTQLLSSPASTHICSSFSRVILPLSPICRL